jgi:hypothetical protein
MKKIRFTRQSTLTLALALGVHIFTAPPAEACGGFFCSQTQPVNQAAERIIFSNNGDGTVTAVIQILYEGPSENFSWLLPISSVPDAEGEIEVASDEAFRRLQAATNPQYNLNLRVEGTCREDQNFGNAASGAVAPQAPGIPGSESDSGGGVSVAASGVVGAFDWTALALDPALEDPAGAALDWLTENGYDVLPNSAELIGPYLESGMYLLALRLTKGRDTGSIRPIVLTYDGDLPSIPIKLTAVAANEDMGVMTWMLSGARAVPFNYSALELNEARINWFNAALNYDSVVTAAADDIGGQGFVTEFAGDSTSLGKVVWSDSEEQDWQSVKSQVFSSFQELFDATYFRYSSFDGFWDAVGASIVLPSGVTMEDFQSCPQCYSGQVTLTPSTYFATLESEVIQPIRRVQQLLTGQPYVTRLYSTLSAADMTVDPVFTFNPSLPAVSNVHNADRIIECSPSVYQFEAPWRIELPQGSVVRGTAQSVGTWPTAFDEQPANVRVLSLGATGSGQVMQDNAETIDGMLATYNASVPLPAGADPFLPDLGGPSAVDPSSMLPSVEAPGGGLGSGPTGRSESSSGCSLPGNPGSAAGARGLAFLMLAGLGLGRLRRRV